MPVNVVSGGRITAVQWSPRARRLPENIFTSLVYRVSFPYPANWRQVSEERYEGPTVFQVSAISSSDPITGVCHAEAFHPLMPYGSSPTIIHVKVQHQDACFIFPSVDQPAEMNKQSALIIRYPRPVLIGETFYNYFILFADVNHIRQMGARLSFL